jgi:hypothetical protein
LAAMSAFGILHYEIIDTSKSGITAAKFKDFLSNLIPLVGPTSRLLLDNAKIHKVNTVLAILDHFQIEYLFLSPYSPIHFVNILVPLFSKLAIPNGIKGKFLQNYNSKSLFTLIIR